MAYKRNIDRLPIPPSVASPRYPAIGDHMRLLATAALCLPLLASPALAQTAPSGEQVFRGQCGACHALDTRNRVGPGLAGVFGRRAAAVETFRYSSAMRAKAEEGLTWDEASLRAYLQSPKQVVPGGSMSYAGQRDEGRLDALVGYLKENAGS